ncbi:hypothetical protein SARC_13990 [Sphaeroforma arctica JP610]|uniref:Uncharacterized protein n=1 Tax=Sphaeroforma arctica JP610 TaxID=667725 RepID=A0A0L0F9R4_9EUKA|nr:hypothetical protein SARC_13990 [Sphaeroforma arctica JP610]KNC73450.1 hypothetical protein SARC_13990 [Sphaeroforma arctica JP610]|eukprot:XP_014147352.1 hypothetical protein SARC_13990 [Sphaeroforma arctica JP610]
MDPRSTYRNGQMMSVPGRMNQTSQMLMSLQHTVNARDVKEGSQGQSSQRQRELLKNQRATNSARGGRPKHSKIPTEICKLPSLELQDRVLSLLDSEQGTEAMVRDAVAAVRDRRAQLEQQTRAYVRREDVPLLAVGSRVWYRLRGKSHDLSSRWGGPARVVAVQAPLTHTVEMSDGSHRTFLRAELKPHVEKLSEQEEQRSVVQYRPHSPYEEWLMHHSPLTERQDGYRQAFDHAMHRTKQARTWAGTLGVVVRRGESTIHCATGGR